MREITNMVPVNKYACDICGEEYDDEQNAEKCECIHLIMEYIKTLQVGHIYYFPWLKDGVIFIENIRKEDTYFSIKRFGDEDTISPSIFLAVRNKYAYFLLETVKERLAQIKEITPAEAIEIGMNINKTVLMASTELAKEYRKLLLKQSPLDLINHFYADGELTGLTTEDITNALLSNYNAHFCKKCGNKHITVGLAMSCKAIDEILEEIQKIERGKLYYLTENSDIFAIVESVRVDMTSKIVKIEIRNKQYNIYEVRFFNLPYYDNLINSAKKEFGAIRQKSFREAFSEGWMPSEKELRRYSELRNAYEKYVDNKTSI